MPRHWPWYPRAPLRRLPIRWRLTIWYAALLAAALLLFAVAVYSGLRRLQYDALDATLRAQAALARAGVRVVDGTPQLGTALATDPHAREHVARLFDRRGVGLAEARVGPDTAPPQPDDVAAALAGETRRRWIAVGDEPVRVLTEPLTVDGQVVGALQISMFADDIAAGLDLTLLVLAVAGPVVLVVASLGGYALAGRALVPVDRITRLAGAIGERDLARRVDLALPPDEIGRLARTFNAMLDRLEAAFRRERRFTADAAHELRTPLSLLRGQLEVALARPRDPVEDQLALEALAGDVERVARLATTLLALARSDAGELRLSREAVDLAALVDLVAEQYAAVAAADGVRVVADALPATLEADGDRVLQVLVNLVDNAARHSPPGGTVTIGCRADGAAARLWVADAGPGIPAEHLPQVFDRFYRVDPGRDRARGGLGLGLSISKELVEAHGGAIAIASTPGAGTTVTVSLPRRPHAPPSARAAAHDRGL